MQNQSTSADIGPVIQALAELRANGIIGKYAIGGAFAAVLHAEPISTIDLDIFFVFREPQKGSILSLDKIYEFARTRDFSFDHEFININGWLVQFVEVGNNPLWSEAVENAETISPGGSETWVIGKEYLVAMWLFAGRAKDYQKISMFMEAGIVDHKKLADILERFELNAKWVVEEWRFRYET